MQFTDQEKKRTKPVVHKCTGLPDGSVMDSLTRDQAAAVARVRAELNFRHAGSTKFTMGRGAIPNSAHNSHKRSTTENDIKVFFSKLFSRPQPKAVNWSVS